jgi:DNA ligase-1
LWTFVTRNGKTYNAPSSFTDGIPKVDLDGELWLGRGKFNECSGICRRKTPRKEEWERLTYMVFDAPGIAGGLAHRLKALQEKVRNWPVNLECVEQSCTDNNYSLREELRLVEKGGGEGLIARHPDSLYEGRRSEHMLKIISRHRCEITVTGYAPGEGKHTGRMGALLGRTEDGCAVSVGTGFTDADRERPPKVGSVVTIEFRERFPSGAPRFPSYVTERDYE